VDPIRNPYTPGARTRPSELAGRDEEIDNFKILLARLRSDRPEQSQIISGLRGVGKTVLLNTFEDLAEGAGYLTVFRELTQETALPELLAKDTQRLLRDLRLSARVAGAVRTGLSTLTAFKLTDPNGFELSVDLKKLQERTLTDDLIELFLALGRAAQALRQRHQPHRFLRVDALLVREDRERVLESPRDRFPLRRYPLAVETHRLRPRLGLLDPKGLVALALRCGGLLVAPRQTKRTRRTTPTSKSPNVLTADERTAMKELVQEREAQARGEDGERAVLGKIAEMPEPDRAKAERLHAIVKASAPSAFILTRTSARILASRIPRDARILSASGRVAFPLSIRARSPSSFCGPSTIPFDYSTAGEGSVRSSCAAPAARAPCDDEVVIETQQEVVRR
jgi:hypothetical protein